MRAFSFPSAFFWKRIHSLTGIFLVLFLIEHLFVNSQAALLLGDDGLGFIEAANAIHNLPYLPVLEMFLLGVPILLHAAWGIAYLRESKINSLTGDGTVPYLPDLPRNRAYTWQRVTSWILLIAIVGHVIHMRIVEYPDSARQGHVHRYMVRVYGDEGLYTLAERLGFLIYTKQLIAEAKQVEMEALSQLAGMNTPVAEQQRREQQAWMAALQKKVLGPGEVIAVTPDFGTAELLIVRESFKMPLTMALYTIFVLAACYHAFNGLWSFLIRWGITLSPRSQERALRFCWMLMVLIAFFGLASIWGTYWINLKR